MPELPEVETVCRVMRRVLVGNRIVDADIAPDDIVYGSTPPEAVKAAFEGRQVTGIGRKGKFWWIEFAEPPFVFGHLGMSGWIREMGAFTVRLREHGEMPLDDETGRPRFLKFLLTTDEGRRVCFTDGRRLGRVWLGDSPDHDRRIQKLGPDARDHLPKGKDFSKLFSTRRAPIKALLMDQFIISGLGNWLADEVLYQARIAPQRAASSLTDAEFSKLRKAIVSVVQIAVEAGANSELYPKSFLFHYRWGGDRGQESINGRQILRDQVGGRTTAWVPSLQR